MIHAWAIGLGIGFLTGCGFGLWWGYQWGQADAVILLQSPPTKEGE